MKKLFRFLRLGFPIAFVTFLIDYIIKQFTTSDVNTVPSFIGTVVLLVIECALIGWFANAAFNIESDVWGDKEK